MADWFGDNGPTADQIEALYQQDLGRSSYGDPGAASWIGNPNAAAGIAGSAEANAYRNQAIGPAVNIPKTNPDGSLIGGVVGNTSGGPGSPTPAAASGDWINQALTSAQSTDDPAYWQRVRGADPKVAAGDPSAIAYWQGRIAQGDGALAVRNGTVQKFNDSSGGSNLGGMATAAGSQAVPGYTPPPAPGYQNFNPGLYQAPAPLAAATPYVLPTAAEARATPGYDFTQSEAMRGAQQSAIAKGAGLTGGSLRDLESLSGNIADTYYGNRVNQGLSAASYNEQNRQNVYGINASTGLNAYQANTSAGLGAGQLNLQGTNQQFQNTQVPAWQAYQSNVQQNQFGQSQAQNQNQFNANYGLTAQNQFWNQGFNENQNAFNQYNTTQGTAFDQWLKVAQLGNPGNPYA